MRRVSNFKCMFCWSEWSKSTVGRPCNRKTSGEHSFGLVEEYEYIEERKSVIIGEYDKE